MSDDTIMIFGGSGSKALAAQAIRRVHTTQSISVLFDEGKVES